MNYELAMDRVSMTYSWHNINEGYGNNKSNIAQIMELIGKKLYLSTECIVIPISMNI